VKTFVATFVVTFVVPVPNRDFDKVGDAGCDKKVWIFRTWARRPGLKFGAM
jgi:hypothetical protein